MIPYAGGVLVAFSNAGGDKGDHRIWFSRHGNGLGGGELVYDGSSAVIAMIPFKRGDKEGVLVAFQGPRAGKHGNAVHWGADGKELGGGDPSPYYDGSTPITAMLAYNGGVFTAFRGSGDPDPDACPLPSICAGPVLICRTGKQRGLSVLPTRVNPAEFAYREHRCLKLRRSVVRCCRLWARSPSLPIRCS